MARPPVVLHRSDSDRHCSFGVHVRRWLRGRIRRRSCGGARPRQNPRRHEQSTRSESKALKFRAHDRYCPCYDQPTTPENQPMLKSLFAPPLLAAGVLLSYLPHAHAEPVCIGPWKSLPAGVEWGEPSTCTCSSSPNTVSGGVYVSSNMAGWLWSNGTGKVTVYVEMKRRVTQGGVTSIETTESLGINLLTGTPFIGRNGGGIEGALRTFDSSEWTWTGRYRAACDLELR